MFPSCAAYSVLSTLHPLDLAICLSAGVVSIIWFEGLKMFKTGKSNLLPFLIVRMKGFIFFKN